MTFKPVDTWNVSTCKIKLQIVYVIKRWSWLPYYPVQQTVSLKLCIHSWTKQSTGYLQTICELIKGEIFILDTYHKLQYKYSTDVYHNSGPIPLDLSKKLTARDLGWSSPCIIYKQFEELSEGNVWKNPLSDDPRIIWFDSAYIFSQSALFAVFCNVHHGS